MISKSGWDGDTFLHQYSSFCSCPEPSYTSHPVPLKVWLPDRLLPQHYYICESQMLDFLISQEKLIDFLVPVIVQIFMSPTKSL